MLLNQAYLSFGEMADRWARESADHPAALERDKILARIVAGLLNDEFNYAELTIWRTVQRGIDGNGNYVVQYKGRRPVTRDMLNYLLFHDAPDKYNKQNLEELRISQKAFGQWCDDQELERPAFWFHGTKSKKQRKTTVRDERKCEAWLVGLMNEDKPPEKTKTEYRANAKENFDIGTRAFDRAWANAVTTTDNTTWITPGPKSIQNTN